jgi:DNA phosphorothioation-associated putative methyltransferase
MVGKRVRGDVYVHRDAIAGLAEPARVKLERALNRAGAFSWNVVRIGSSDVSLLCYEDFDKAAFPSLLSSANIKLVGESEPRLVNYEARKSRPILHRKELLLADNDPRAPKFAALTRSAEEKGLFQEPRKIGTSAAWEALLADKNLEVRGSEFVERGAPHVTVARHRTALVRRQLSQPLALALRLGVISDSGRIFDYGCGQGDDVAILQANGYEAFGWDPHFRQDGDRRAADVVNLGFVLNVIESVPERVETLRAAWSFAKRALIVAVMNRASFSEGAGWRPYKDGVLTSRGTFQRYFSQGDLRALIEMSLNARAMTLAPGIVAVFRDKELEQEVSYRRRSAAAQYFDRLKLEAPERGPQLRAARPDVGELAPGAVEAIVRQALELGRLPAAPELSSEIKAELEAAGLNAARVLAFCSRTVGSGDRLQKIAQARREDLLAHFALSFFPGAPKYSSLPPSIQLDVRTFFQSHTSMLGQARALLFSLGDGKSVQGAIEQAVQSGLAGQRGAKVRFVASALPRMPVLVRLLIGCGEVLDPDLATADFFDVYPDGGRVRGLWSEDPRARAPVLTEMAEIIFGKLQARRRSRVGDVIYDKGQFLPQDDPDRPAQLAFDAQLRAAGIVNQAGDGPDIAGLRKAGLHIT